MLQESDLKAAFLQLDVVNKNDRNDRENKHNQSRFKCLTVTPVKKQALAWPQLKTRKRK